MDRRELLTHQETIVSVYRTLHRSTRDKWPHNRDQTIMLILINSKRDFFDKNYHEEFFNSSSLTPRIKVDRPVIDSEHATSSIHVCTIPSRTVLSLRGFFSPFRQGQKNSPSVQPIARSNSMNSMNPATQTQMINPSHINRNKRRILPLWSLLSTVWIGMSMTLFTGDHGLLLANTIYMPSPQTYSRLHTVVTYKRVSPEECT
jgi:hypothetical protein